MRQFSGPNQPATPNCRSDDFLGLLLESCQLHSRLRRGKLSGWDQPNRIRVGASLRPECRCPESSLRRSLPRSGAERELNQQSRHARVRREWPPLIVKGRSSLRPSVLVDWLRLTAAGHHQRSHVARISATPRRSDPRRPRANCDPLRAPELLHAAALEATTRSSRGGMTPSARP